MNKEMHFAFGINDGYLPYVIVTIKSILENNKGNICIFHILSDGISNTNKEWISNEISVYEDVSIEYHHVDKSLLQGVKSTWSVYAWMRIFLPELLPTVEKVLYLDADITVSENLSSLFEMDMSGTSIAAVLDMETHNPLTFHRCGYEMPQGYICSGVLMMNLDFWRKNNLTGKILDWAREKNNTIKFPDQDAINYICRDTKILLPLRYGIVDGFFTSDLFIKAGYTTEIKDSFNTPAIIHYAGQSPWIYERAKHVLQPYWNKFNNMLAKPVRRRYESKGLLLVKIVIWRLLHQDETKEKYNAIKRKVENL